MEKSKDDANRLMVAAGGTVGTAAGFAATSAAASAVAASVTPVAATTFAGITFTSGGVVAASPALVLLAANPVIGPAVGAAVLGVGAYKLGKWLLED